MTILDNNDIVTPKKKTDPVVKSDIEEKYEQEGESRTDRKRNLRQIKDKPHKLSRIDLNAKKAKREETRRLNKLKIKQKQAKYRQVLFESLQNHAAEPAQLSLMNSTSKLGQSFTKKESLERALLKERAGLSIGDQSLYVERPFIDIQESSIPVSSLATYSTELLKDYSELLEDRSLVVQQAKRKKKGTKKKETKKLKAQTQTLFSYIESSSSDSEGDIMRSNLQEKYKNGDEDENYGQLKHYDMNFPSSITDDRCCNDNLSNKVENCNRHDSYVTGDCSFSASDDGEQTTFKLEQSNSAITRSYKVQPPVDLATVNLDGNDNYVAGDNNDVESDFVIKEKSTDDIISDIKSSFTNDKHIAPVKKIDWNLNLAYSFSSNKTTGISTASSMRKALEKRGKVIEFNETQRSNSSHTISPDKLKVVHVEQKPNDHTSECKDHFYKNEPVMSVGRNYEGGGSLQDEIKTSENHLLSPHTVSEQSRLDYSSSTNNGPSNEVIVTNNNEPRPDDNRDNIYKGTDAESQKNYLDSTINSSQPAQGEIDGIMRVELHSPAATLAPTISSNTINKSGAYYVVVNRTEEVQSTRSKLPILVEEYQIIDLIRHNDFIILSGETGSGKTTQVPQFLYEAGYGHKNSNNPGKIGVTQPRRIAAISTAQRIAFELNQPIPTIENDIQSLSDNISNFNEKSKSTFTSKQGHVGYQVRYDSHTSKQTRIKIMTDGILLREIQSDFLLSNYSAIIIDEAHERSMNTDLLIGLLSRIVPLRREIWTEQQQKDESASNLSTCTMTNDSIHTNPHKNQSTNKVHSLLKVIIMSATIRISDFMDNQNMFPNGPPPIIQIKSRQYPVTVHFNRRTSEVSYIEDAFSKIVKIHTKLPPGGILVFLSGQDEIYQLVSMINERFLESQSELETNFDQETKNNNESECIPNNENTDPNSSSDVHNLSTECIHKEYNANQDQKQDEAGLKSTEPKMGAATLALNAGDASNHIAVSSSNAHIYDQISLNSLNSPVYDISANSKNDSINRPDKRCQELPSKVMAMPLYSMLSPKEQMKIFQSVPPNARLIVVATNVAETSLTIPGITYVVDSGRVKVKEYEKTTGMTTFKVTWISKASAAQRAGRAGRTSIGHCYRLYSSAVYNDLPDFSPPHILTLPVDGMLLQIKCMGIQRLETFPFPTPPDIRGLKAAYQTLTFIGALESPQKNFTNLEDNTMLNEDYILTPIGQKLANFPLSPRFAKMLLLAMDNNCIDYVIAIVASLAVGDPFLHSLQHSMPGVRDPRQTIWSQWSSETSDLLVRLAAIGAYEFTETSKKNSFCETYGLHFKTMREIHLLRAQIKSIIANKIFNSPSNITNRKLGRTNSSMPLLELMELEADSTKDTDVGAIINESKKNDSRACHTSFDGRMDPPNREQKHTIRRIITAGLLDQVAKRYPIINDKGIPLKNRWFYKTVKRLQECEIHPSSFLKSNAPEYVAYSELINTSSGFFLCGVTAVQLDWLPSLAPWACKKMGHFLEITPIRYDKKMDAIVGVIEPVYVHSDWVIPKLFQPLEDQVAIAKHFAKSFLEGNIYPEMKYFQPYLIKHPLILNERTTNTLVIEIIQPLIEHKIGSRAKMNEIWMKNPKFLLSEVSSWISTNKREALEKLWPLVKRKMP